MADHAKIVVVLGRSCERGVGRKVPKLATTVETSACGDSSEQRRGYLLQTLLGYLYWRGTMKFKAVLTCLVGGVFGGFLFQACSGGYAGGQINQCRLLMGSSYSYWGSACPNSHFMIGYQTGQLICAPLDISCY